MLLVSHNTRLNWRTFIPIVFFNCTAWVFMLTKDDFCSTTPIPTINSLYSLDSDVETA